MGLHISYRYVFAMGYFRSLQKQSFRPEQNRKTWIWSDIMNDLHLSSDDRTPFQAHLDELSRKITSVVILIVILTGIWSISIDEILRYTLNQLDPCSESCINIFSPDEWAGTRWLSAAIMGVLTCALCNDTSVRICENNGSTP